MESAPAGGDVVPVTILFADVRGFTSYAESHDAAVTTELMSRFYSTASRVLLKYEAVLATMAGDQVMALFLPGFAGPTYKKRAVEASRALLMGLGYGHGDENWLDVGMGISSGDDYVGNVAGGGFKDFTSIGDATNTAARLQACARSGEVVVDTPTYATVTDSWPAIERVELKLKGKQNPVTGYRLGISRR